MKMKTFGKRNQLIGKKEKKLSIEMENQLQIQQIKQSLKSDYANESRKKIEYNSHVLNELA